MKRLFLLLILLGISGVVTARTTGSLERTVTAAGGARAQSAHHVLHGTMGQAVAGPATAGGPHEILQGFWLPRSLRPTGVPETTLPRVFTLHGNVPNPFNPRTEIRFDLAEDAPGVELWIYTARGQVVRRLHQGALPAGRHAFVWDGADDAGRPVSSGVYFLSLQTSEHHATHKLSLVR